MPRGSKEKYTSKQKRQAEHIEKGYKKRGAPAAKAERIAWATVNKESGGGKKSGSGRKKKSVTATKKMEKNKKAGKRPVGRPKGSKNKKNK